MEWLLHLLGLVSTSVAVYAGIRADLAGLHARMDIVEKAASKAHGRIDELLVRRR